jgi:HSP20 family molecular chaperone IbpA
MDEINSPSDPKPGIQWHSIEWRPEHHDGSPNAEEFRALQEMVRRVYPVMAGQPKPEHPDFNIWFGERQLILSGNLPGIDPGSIQVALVGQTLYVRGLYQKIEGQTRRRFFERSFVLPYAVAPETLRVSWLMGYLLIEAQRPPGAMPEAA